MSDTNTHSTSAHEEEHIHMPPPSFSPFLISLGLTGIGFGLVLGRVQVSAGVDLPILLIIGAIVFAVGFGVAMMEEFRNAH